MEATPRTTAEWARWCRTPDYLGDWRGHAAFGAPLLAIGLTDDPYAPPRAVAALCDRYGSADQTRQSLSPGDVGLRRIGHFGFFRPESATLWSRVGEWITEKIGV